MVNEPILQIEASPTFQDHATTDKFYKWQEEVFLPQMFKYPGTERILSCHLITQVEPISPLVNDYPEHLTITQYFNLKDMGKYLESRGARHLNEQRLKIWGSEIFQKQTWSVAYRENITYARKVEGRGKRVIQIVSCVKPSDPETAEKFYRWYDMEHTPDVFQNAGIVKASCYRQIEIEKTVKPLVNDYPYHLAIFEFKSRKILDEIIAGFKGEVPDLGGWGAEIGRKKVWLATYEVNKFWER
jgi:hypothetical protein